MEIQKYDVFKHGFTQSMLVAMRTCPVKFRMMTKGLRISGGDGFALIFGNVYHGYQEVVLGSLKGKGKGVPASPEDIQMAKMEKAVEGLLQEDMDGASPDEQQHFESAFAQNKVLIPRYFKHWQHLYFGKNAAYEVVSLEEEFCVELGFGIPFRGKFDGILRHKKTKKLWLLEHKTKSTINPEEIMMMVPQDVQTILYSMAVNAIYGEFPAGILYNVTRRPALRRSAKESLTEFVGRIEADIDARPDHYFMMFEIINSPEDVLKQFEWLSPDVKRLRAIATQDGAKDAPYSHSCINPSYSCQYLRYCASGRTDTDYLTQTVLFPELKQANQPQDEREAKNG